MLGKNSKVLYIGVLGEVMMKQSILKELIEIRERIDSLIETIEVMSDEELMESIRRAEQDIRAGRIKPFEEFLKELDEEA